MTAREIEDAVYAILSDAARDGAPLPSAKSLGRAVGVSDYTAGRAMARLHKSGRIVLVARSHPYRRSAEVPGVGITDWNSMIRGSGHKPEPALRITPESDPWAALGNCFADIETHDDVGRAPTAATVVLRVGVLA